MLRFLSVAMLLAALACGDTGLPGIATVSLSPLLDSLFVGDTAPPGSFAATYRDASGQVRPGGVVRWTASNPAVLQVDSVTGRVVAVAAGASVLQVAVDGIPGRALLVVSRTLDVALLLDTIYLMPGDTLTVPVDVRRKGGSPPPVRFNPSPNPTVYTIDTVTGLITAQAEGQPTRLVVRADTVADTGAVEVVVLTDTVGGKSYFTILGTAIRRARETARAQNYARQGAQPTFRLNSTITSSGIIIENVLVTLLMSVTTPGVFGIDSISPNEATFGAGSDFVCRPTRAWGLWSTLTASLDLTALSRTGTIRVARVVTIPNGLAISGTFRFDAQRLDFYHDPLGVLPVRGTFVAPLITNPETCGN